MSRDYAKVAPQFWTGPTGKLIRAAGRDTQLIALYLLTCPSANMMGLYYLPLPTLCHELGCPIQGARKALRSLSEAHFAYYDEEREQVWVPEMARFQLGDSLQAGDKRIIGLKKELQHLRNSPFFNAFLDKYKTVYHLLDISPSEAPPKPHRSQEQEQEQDQEQEQEHEQESPPSPPKGVNGFQAFWDRYPKQEGYGKAQEAWNKHAKRIPLEAILGAIGKWEQSQKWADGYVPMPATWLNQKRWKDNPAPAKPKEFVTAQDIWDDAQRREEKADG